MTRLTAHATVLHMHASHVGTLGRGTLRHAWHAPATAIFLCPFFGILVVRFFQHRIIIGRYGASYLIGFGYKCCCQSGPSVNFVPKCQSGTREERFRPLCLAQSRCLYTPDNFYPNLSLILHDVHPRGSIYRGPNNIS